MLGASVYIVPFMIQRNVEGIGPNVVPAFMLAAIPAIFAAFAYAALSTAMPVAGGSYIYASRGLNPYLGFIASFSQWFGLSIAIGVIAYVIVPFIRDIAVVLEWLDLAQILDSGFYRLVIALLLLWAFVAINMLGLKSYQNTLIPLMIFMFLLGAVVIFFGFSHNHSEFMQSSGISLSTQPAPNTDLKTFLSAAAVLFASFIGFDSIAQAGSEAKNPTRNMPLAIILTISVVGLFYFLFTSAVYHAVPWSYVYHQALLQDITAPGLLSPLLTPLTGAMIILGAAVALINDLPAMLLSVSRLMFAWARDGIFPNMVAKIHPKYNTPHIALVISGLVATLGILGSHFAGDFFLGVDIMVTSMLVNFLLMCITLGLIYSRNQAIASKIVFPKTKFTSLFISIGGVMFLLIFLGVHLAKDLGTEKIWYLKSTWVWLLVMMIGTVLFLVASRNLKRKGVNLKERFNSIPE